MSSDTFHLQLPQSSISFVMYMIQHKVGEKQVSNNNLVFNRCSKKCLVEPPNTDIVSSA